MTPFTPLRDGEILDGGYGEFMATPAFAAELIAGGMARVNGNPVRLEVVDDGLSSVNAVLVRVHQAAA